MKAVNVDGVLKILHEYGKYIFVTDEKRYSSMVDEIANLKALEQDTVPFDFELYQAGLMDMPKGMIEVLDKIKADIIELRSRQDVGVLECLEIIDKYKTESED